MSLLEDALELGEDLFDLIGEYPEVAAAWAAWAAPCVLGITATAATAGAAAPVGAVTCAGLFGAAVVMTGQAALREAAEQAEAWMDRRRRAAVQDLVRRTVTRKAAEKVRDTGGGSEELRGIMSRLDLTQGRLTAAYFAAPSAPRVSAQAGIHWIECARYGAAPRVWASVSARTPRLAALGTPLDLYLAAVDVGRWMMSTVGVPAGVLYVAVPAFFEQWLGLDAATQGPRAGALPPNVSADAMPIYAATFDRAPDSMSTSHWTRALEIAMARDGQAGRYYAATILDLVSAAGLAASRMPPIEAQSSGIVGSPWAVSDARRARLLSSLDAGVIDFMASTTARGLTLASGWLYGHRLGASLYAAAGRYDAGIPLSDVERTLVGEGAWAWCDLYLIGKLMQSGFAINLGEDSGPGRALRAMSAPSAGASQESQGSQESQESLRRFNEALDDAAVDRLARFGESRRGLVDELAAELVPPKPPAAKASGSGGVLAVGAVGALAYYLLKGMK